MTMKSFTVVGAVIVAILSLSSCGNTIRGMGRDTANTVNATQDAGKTVDNAAKY